MQESAAGALNRFLSAQDPVYRMQQQLARGEEAYARAVQQGIPITEQQVAALDRVRARYTAVTQGAATASGRLDAVGQSSRRVGADFTNLAHQVQDVVVQLSAGTNPLQVLIQQGGQIATAFGPAFGAAGIMVVGVGAALLAITKLTGAIEDQDAAQRTNDALKVTLAESAKSVDDLASKYRTLSQEMQAVARVAAQSAITTASKEIDTLRGSVSGDLDAASRRRAVFEAGERLRRRDGVQVSPEQQAEFDRIRQAYDAIDRFRAGGSIPELVAELERLGKAGGAAGKQAMELAQQFADEATRAEELRKTIERSEAELALYNGTATEAQKRLLNIGLGADNARKSLESLDPAIRRATELAREEEKAREDAHERARAIIAEDDKRRAGLEKYIQGLEVAADAEGQNSAEKKVQLALQEAQNKLVDQYGHKLRDLTEEERRRIEVAVRQKDALEEQRKAAEKFEREVKRQVDRIADNLSRSMGDVFFDALEGKTTNFWDLFEQLGKRAIANLAAEAIVGEFLRPTIQSVVQSFPQWFGLSAPAGAAGFSGMNGVTIANGGATGGGGGAAAFGVGGTSTTAGVPWGQIAGGGLMGLGIGAAIGSMQPFGRTGPGGAIGGTIGGAAGMVVGGPIGALVGSVAGGLIGSAFGPKPSKGPSLFSTLRVDESGRLIAPDWGVDNGASMADAEKFAKQWAQTLNSFATITGADFLSDIGISTSARKGLALWGPGGPRSTTEAGLIRDVLLGQTAGMSDVFRTALGRSQATDAQGLLSDLQFAQQVDDLNRNVDPLTQSLRAVNQEFEAMKRRAEDLGLATDGVTRAWEQAKKAAEAQADAAAIQGVGGVTNFLSQLSFSPLSALTPEQQFAQAERQFQAIAGAAAGDINSLQQFQGAATQYLTLAQQRFASGPGFVDAFNKVLGFADQIGNVSADGWRAATSAIQQQTVTLSDELKALREEVTRLRREVNQGQIQQAFAA